jgi:hypothetical protein
MALEPDVTVGAAYRDRPTVGTTHHHALEDRLAAVVVGCHLGDVSREVGDVARPRIGAGCRDLGFLVLRHGALSGSGTGPTRLST